MNYEEFASWLQSLVASNRLSPPDMFDVLEQRRLFDERREDLETHYPGEVVGFVAFEFVFGHHVSEFLDRMRERYGPRLVYFEQIGERRSQETS